MIVASDTGTGERNHRLDVTVSLSRGRGKVTTGW
jgi:hypothetical protein